MSVIHYGTKSFEVLAYVCEFAGTIGPDEIATNTGRDLKAVRLEVSALRRYGLVAAGTPYRATMKGQRHYESAMGTAGTRASPEDQPERWKRIVEARDARENYADIAAREGIAIGRVLAIYKREKARAKARDSRPLHEALDGAGDDFGWIVRALRGRPKARALLAEFGGEFIGEAPVTEVGDPFWEPKTLLDLHKGLVEVRRERRTALRPPTRH
jgi:hypothetical protein